MTTAVAGALALAMSLLSACETGTGAPAAAPVSPPTAPVAAPVVGKDGGPSGAFTFSSDAAIATVQRDVKAVIQKYQDALNASDTDTIVSLFAPDAVVEWNGKPTWIGPAALAQPYTELFQSEDFTTDFQTDAVDIHGDTAVVRTHHPIGQMVRKVADNSSELDFNREIFVLGRSPQGHWQIILYSFNTQPRQGEQ